MNFLFIQIYNTPPISDPHFPRLSPGYRWPVPSSPSSSTSRRYQILALLFTHIFRVIVSGYETAATVLSLCIQESFFEAPLSLSLFLPPFLLFIVSFDGRRLRARSEVFVHGHPVDDGTSRGSVKNPHATVTANTG